MSLADLAKLRETVSSPMTNDTAGSGAAGHMPESTHAHAMLSAAARLVEAMHAHDAHGVHSALSAHHDAWKAREAEDEKSED